MRLSLATNKLFLITSAALCFFRAATATCCCVVRWDVEVPFNLNNVAKASVRFARRDAKFRDAMLESDEKSEGEENVELKRVKVPSRFSDPKLGMQYSQGGGVSRKAVNVHCWACMHGRC